MSETAMNEEYDVDVQILDVSKHPEYKRHEFLFRMSAPAHDFVAFVGVHSTVLGAGEGGIRFKSYDSEDEAITDVLRLSEGMTLKNAAAGLSAGGGKSVVMAREGLAKPDDAVLRLLAAGLNKINADKTLYYGAQDMNISEANLNMMTGYTQFIKGATATEPSIVGGNPSPLTAIGVFEAMKVAVAEKFGPETPLSDMTVSMQGIGSVGGDLARLLHEAGATLIASDVSDEAFAALDADGVKVKRVGLEEIYDAEADVFAPNAIGGTLTTKTVSRLNANGIKVVCGAANNQQRDQVGHKQSKLMAELDVLYCPDFIVNASGIIWVNQVGENALEVQNRVRTHMPASLKRILDMQPEQGGDMGSIAEDYALGVVKAARV
jgi:leucine dehydrogenase